MIRLNSTETPPSETVRQSASQVVHDLVVLTELQGQLFRMMPATSLNAA